MTSGERLEEPRPTGRWRNGTTPVIGLTGGVASGKSAVAALLAEHGCATIDADLVGHDVLELSHVRQQLVDRFGARVLLEPARGTGDSAGPRIDRRALAAIVFADPIARSALEVIVHPLDAGAICRGDPVKDRKRSRACGSGCRHSARSRLARSLRHGGLRRFAPNSENAQGRRTARLVRGCVSARVSKRNGRARKNDVEPILSSGTTLTSIR